MQVSQISSATSSISYSYPGSGIYDAAYDIWLDPTPKKDAVNKQEVMIWFNHQGPIQPVGSKTATATIGGRTWDIWTGNNGMNDVVSYVAPAPIPSWNFSILDFVKDTKTRGNVTDSWYLTSIQAGFEPWVGGAGLAIKSFSASVNGGGGGGSTPPPPPPPAKADGRTYVVQPGDTLSSIAQRQGVKGGWKSLYKLNRSVVGTDPGLIHAGQRLSL
jgi:hypothetical protein